MFPDTVESLICVVGAIFLFIAFISGGNGVHIKDIVIPALTRATRYAMGIIGFLFVILGLIAPSFKALTEPSIPEIRNEIESEKEKTVQELEEKLDTVLKLLEKTTDDEELLQEKKTQTSVAFDNIKQAVEVEFQKKEVKKIKESVESEPEKLIVEYFGAIGRRDYVGAANMWEKTPASLYDLMRNIEYYDLEDLKAIDISENDATVSVVLNAKNVGELKQKWKGNIKLEKVDGQWKILSLAGLKNVTSS